MNAEIVYVDLSRPLVDGDIPYTGDPCTRVARWATLEEDGYRLSHLSFGTHSATHMDAPYHLFPSGKSLDSTPLRRFFSQAYVLDCRNVFSIGADILWLIPPGIGSVLFYTGWQDKWGREGYFQGHPTLTGEATTLLLERGISLFGFDCSSCDAHGSGSLPIHHQILLQDGLILENLCNLDKVVGRTISLVALPLLVEASDGSPTRVVASYTA